MMIRYLCTAIMVFALMAPGASASADDSLHQYVQNGDVEQVKAIIAKNPKLLNSKGIYGCTPLALAAGNKAMIKVLLDAGAVMDIETAAALGDSTQLAKILKDKPWLAKAPNKPLHEAARSGDLKCVEILLAHGADPNLDMGFTNILGPYTPLSEAVTSDHLEISQLLLEHGAKADVSGGKNHHSLFFYTITNCDARFVKVMLDHKADPNEINDRGSTPLHAAAQIGDVEKTRLLLEHNANVSAVDNDKATALTLAFRGGHDKVVALLLKKAALQYAPFGGLMFP